MSADPLEYIVNDAICECDKGAKPNFFKSTYNTHVKIMGCLAATRVDKIPLVNIPEFGVCTISGGPCVPAPVEWLDTYKLKVKGEETLLFRCTLPCSVGGIVSFITSGQIPISPEELAAMIDENSEEGPPIEETVEEQVPVEETVEEGGDGGGLSGWDAAEMIPFAGGVIGMVRSGASGDGLGFGLSLASLALDVGGLFSFGAGNAASAAVKGGKIARVGYKAAKAYNKTSKVIKGFKTVTKTITKAGPKLLTKAGAKALAKALANRIDDIALKTGKICVFACFPAGTLVDAEHGQIPVEQIKTGDQVWAFNESTGAIALKEVLQTTDRECDHTIELYANRETIETTAEHPFYTTEGWKDAANLQAGDKIITRNDETIQITATKFNYEPKQVYNFEVADWHTYFVGASAWLVHNGATGKCLSEVLDEIKAGKKRLREIMLGKTPSKSSGTGKDVIKRMDKEGLIRKNRKGEATHYKSKKDGQWYKIDEKTDMAHKTDAVRWWNREGRKHNARSERVRDWMKDPDNYYLEHQKYNRSDGAKIRKTYKLPRR